MKLSARRPVVVATGIVAVLAVAVVATVVLAAPRSTPAAASDTASATTTPTSSATPTATATPSAAAAAATAIAPTRVVTIGDSIMAGYGLADGQAWPDLLAADGIAVTNLGCSGGGFIADGSCGTDFTGLIGQAADADPELVIIQSSDNDLGEDDARLAAATTSTLVALRHAFPDATIVGFSTLWDQPDAAPAEIAASSAHLQQAVAAVGGTYLDLGEPLRGNAALLQDDDEHPTVAGQKVLLDTVRSALAGAGIEV
jgi:acyl-CoA thioesterase I